MKTSYRDGSSCVFVPSGSRGDRARSGGVRTRPYIVRPEIVAEETGGERAVLRDGRVRGTVPGPAVSARAGRREKNNYGPRSKPEIPDTCPSFAGREPARVYTYTYNARDLDDCRRWDE